MGGLAGGAIGGLIIGSSAGAGGLFGFTRAKPLCARPSDQSMVAPRSFSTLDSGTTIARSPWRCTTSSWRATCNALREIL